MRCTSTLCALLALTISSPATAGMSNTFLQNGNLAVELTGVAGGNLPTANGTLTLNNLPPTAMVTHAVLYASEVNHGTGLDATFAGNNLGAVGPAASDAAFLTLYSYQWTVTNFVFGGQTAYNFSIGQGTSGNQIAGVALVVVWQDPAEPNRTVSIIDGMQQVGESGAETESVQFTNLPGGPTTVSIFTVSDDTGSSGETVSYNASNIGGPLDANLGFNASLLVMNTTSQAGNNTLAITTGADHMGWMVAVVGNAPQPTEVRAETWGRIKALFR